MSDDDVQGQPAEDSKGRVLNLPVDPIHPDIPSAPDGYRPCVQWLLFLAALGVAPDPEELRLLLSAARRCDSAHRQFQRVRIALDAIRPLAVYQASEVEMAVAAIGDVELGAIALARSLSIAVKTKTNCSLDTGVPAVLREKEKAITQLRHAYEHIDDRAIGKVRWDKYDPAKALSVFAFDSLIKDGRITYAGERLDIYAEATGLLIALRDFIADLWNELVERYGRGRRMHTGDEQHQIAIS